MTMTETILSGAFDGIGSESIRNTLGVSSTDKLIKMVKCIVTPTIICYNGVKHSVPTSDLKFRACLEFLEIPKGEFFTGSLTDVGTIHPDIVLRILQQFGFKKSKAENGLWMIRPYDEWLCEEARFNFNTTHVKELFKSEASELKTFLCLLVQHVNTNQQIFHAKLFTDAIEVRLSNWSSFIYYLLAL